VFVTYNKLTGENNLDGLNDKSVTHERTSDLDTVIIDVSSGGTIGLAPGQTVIYYWLNK
jgi:hypothetical protein